MQDQELNAAIQKGIERAIALYIDPMAADLRSVRRALVGEPLEGNQGILRRMDRTERRVAWMVWMMPVWISLGTASGTIISRWIGL